MNEENNAQAQFNIKDASVTEFEAKYGNYVSNDLEPQLSRLSAYKLTANPMGPGVFSDNEKEDEKIKERFNTIFSRIDIPAIAFTLEERLSRIGNGVLVFEKIKNDKYNIYVPTTTITRVDPSTSQLYYLQVIRYLTGGDLVNVVSEIYTLTSTTRTLHQYDSKEEADKDVASIEKKQGGKLNGKKIEKKPEALEGIKFGKEKNKLGWIPAVYFENIPTTDKRGEPDINHNSRYIGLLNETFIRFHWELKFNKSKFIQEEEMGQNMFSTQFNNQQNQAMIDNNYVIMKNNFGMSMGQANNSNQMFETSNQNFINLLQLFNFFLKKLWEQAGQHQSGSDIGKQISDFQATQEKSAEHLRFKNKVLRRKFVWRELLWRMLLTMSDFGKYNAPPSGYNRDNLEWNMSYAKIDIEKDIIDNEIKKLQANLTSREESIARIADLAQGQDVVALADKYLNRNIEDIIAQQIPEPGQTETLKAKPVQVQNPSTNNPQGSTNNQSKNFSQQTQTNSGGAK